VVVDNQHLEMRPGDCLPIPMGAMHDMPDAPEPVKAVYFETTLRGKKRTGHLWQHTHGPAVREEASL
jgi:mannose-6-phosphate isomerase-like protein (cupin superfamily)